MHFHLPKPLHGWRQLAGEVGIIVLGVLIALSAEQGVSWLHDREDVDQLRRALDSELAEDRARWEQMNGQDKCARQRLDALDHWAVTAPSGVRIGDGYGFLIAGMHLSAWDIAKSSPAAAHIPLEQRLNYASLYAILDNWRGLLGDEDSSIGQLNNLLATANQPENRRQIPLRIVDARRRLDMRRKFYSHLLGLFDRLGIKADASNVSGIVDPSALCRPLKL